VGRAIHQCQCAVCEAGSDPVIQEHHRQMNVRMSKLNEAQRRWYVGSLSQVKDGPSDRELSRMTGLAPKTIRRGRRELATGEAAGLADRQRQAGGGRPQAEKKMGN
jgi:hypothetical protein